MNSKFTSANHINIHYLDNSSEHDQNELPIILMHGLSANAYSFSSILDRMADHYIISVDLRGRGLSDKPDENYSMNDHAKDIIGLMDHLEIETAVIGGHSFGARLSIYLAAKYPERFSKVILMDAAAKLHPNVKEMVMPSVLRLNKTWSSFDSYLQEIKEAPFLNDQWLSEMLPYFKADIKEKEDGSIVTNSSLQHILLAVEGVLGPGEKWVEYITSIRQPSILINATGPYVGNDPILPKDLALETVHMMNDCKYQHVSGNHLTMLFGKGAEEIVNTIKIFLNN